MFENYYPFFHYCLLSCPNMQYLNCRGDASPYRELASPHQDLASPNQDLGVPQSRFERWMIRQKKTNSSPKFDKQTLQFPAKTFFFWSSPSSVGRGSIAPPQWPVN